MNKDVFHKTVAAQLRAAAKRLGLVPGTFQVRSNKAGPAVLGEVVLHAEGLYVSVGCSFGDPQVLYRTCKGRKDYVGGMNNYLSLATFMQDLDLAVEKFKELS